MKKQYLALTFALGVLGFTGCMNTADNSATGQTATDAGQIQLVAMKGLSKVAASSQISDTSSTYTFDLDTIKASQQFYFLLQNTGNHDVYNIQIVSNNPAFTFSPSKIAVLSPSKNTSVQQLIKLSVVHGVLLDGVGFAALLPQGENTANIEMAGSTTNSHNDTLNLSVGAQLKVFAKVMNFTVFNDAAPLNLFNPTYWVIGTGTPTSTPEYRGMDNTCHIVNTGNVDIIVRTWIQPYGTQTFYAIDSVTVAPGVTYFPTVYGAYSDTMGTSIKGQSINVGDYGSVQFDGQGTVSDPSIPKVLDGRIFLRFRSTGNRINDHF